MQLLRDECVAALASSPLTKLAIMRGAGGTGMAKLIVKSGGGVSSRGLFDASVPALPEFDLDEGFSF